MTSYPKKLIDPVKKHLEKELMGLKRQERKVKANDPFFEPGRSTNNSLEEDVDEQIGRFESEVKASFIKKRIIDFRKALTSIKLGKYGICERCGKMIDTDRLAVRPETTICVSCEKERE